MHEGHRKRLLNKMKQGSLYEHEILEALLFFVCPRKDTNPTAHLLLERFGSLRGVLSAPAKELTQVYGVGENVALYLSVLGESFKNRKKVASFATVRSTEQFREFILSRFNGAQKDCLELYFLDRAGRVRRICSAEAVEGARAALAPREIMKSVCVFKPYGVYAAYHRAGEDGGDEPIEEDDCAAAQISAVCELTGTRFYDYCIVRDYKVPFSYYLTDRLSAVKGKFDGR